MIALSQLLILCPLELKFATGLLSAGKVGGMPRGQLTQEARQKTLIPRLKNLIEKDKTRIQELMRSLRERDTRIKELEQQLVDKEAQRREFGLHPLTETTS